jgi:hypothetical protein
MGAGGFEGVNFGISAVAAGDDAGSFANPIAGIEETIMSNRKVNKRDNIPNGFIIFLLVFMLRVGTNSDSEPPGLSRRMGWIH